MWTNYHCHSNYCDGKGTIEEIILSALQKGMKSLGFSSHIPLPFANKWSMAEEKLADYLEELKTLKQKYAPRIEIYSSLEIDFIENVCGVNSDIVKHAGLDYTLCSVHFLGKFENGSYCEIEGSTVNFIKGLEEIWKNDTNEMLRNYFLAFKSMLASAAPTIIGHFDKIKIHRYSSGNFVIDSNSQQFKNEAISCLEAIAKSTSFLEINTRAMYKKELSEPYPSIGLLQIANELGIPFVLNSDSHHPSELDACFETTASLLLAAGIQKVKTLHKNEWIDARITKQGLVY